MESAGASVPIKLGKLRSSLDSYLPEPLIEMVVDYVKPELVRSFHLGDMKISMYRSQVQLNPSTNRWPTLREDGNGNLTTYTYNHNIPVPGSRSYIDEKTSTTTTRVDDNDISDIFIQGGIYLDSPGYSRTIINDGIYTTKYLDGKRRPHVSHTYRFTEPPECSPSINALDLNARRIWEFYSVYRYKGIGYTIDFYESISRNGMARVTIRIKPLRDYGARSTDGLTFSYSLRDVGIRWYPTCNYAIFTGPENAYAIVKHQDIFDHFAKQML